MSAELAKAIEEVLPGVTEDLIKLISIPSVSSLPEHENDVKLSAEKIAQLLTEAKCPDVQIITEGGKPAVVGRYPAPEGKPTVCLYAHHDVQPTGDISKWNSEPFKATKKGDRLFGRGTADDKGGFGVHLAMLRAFNGKPPIGVTLFIEGEEEIGSPSLGKILEKHHELLKSDIFVIADSVNWEVGVPAFTTALRGVARISVELQTLDHVLHSGQFGGQVPDALMALIKLLATLHDDEGNVAVAGLGEANTWGLDYSEERLRQESGLLDGVQPIGSGPIIDRSWSKPAITLIAMDITSTALAANTLTPSVKCTLSLRVAPGADSSEQADILIKHLKDNVPWGAKLKVAVLELGQPGVVPFEGRVSEIAQETYSKAFGKEAVLNGAGGSIPMVAEFQKSFPNADILVTAVTDPDSRMHGIDESLHLGDFAKASLAEALFIKKLAES